MRRRPADSEYVEYYRAYVGQVPDGDIVAILREQMSESAAILEGVSAEAGSYRYAPGKWSLQEVIAHVVDIEWVFTARALHFARNVEGALPGVEQDDMIAATDLSGRSLASQLAEWRHLREAGALFFDNLTDEAWGRTGVALGKSFTVRSVAYIVAGHAHHHMNVIRKKYLNR
jgi:hypothetical protein